MIFHLTQRHGLVTTSRFNPVWVLRCPCGFEGNFTQLCFHLWEIDDLGLHFAEARLASCAT